MKRFITGIVVLSLLLAAGLGVSLTLSGCFRHMERALSEAALAAGENNSGQAAACLASARANWHRWQHFAAAFTDHAPLEEMHTLFVMMDPPMEQMEFATLCLRLATLAGNLAESYTLHWWTFL